MADLIELYEKARLLNLQNLAHGKIDLNQETVSNIDYLDYILSQELELRRQAAIKRHTNASRFYGPLNAYQFYNENLCINILHLVQRDDYSVYITNKKSADQLFIINGNEIPSDLAYNLPLLAEEFKKAVTNHNVLYGYRF